MNKKQTVRLNESQLKRIVNESVKAIIKEAHSTQSNVDLKRQKELSDLNNEKNPLFGIYRALYNVMEAIGRYEFDYSFGNKVQYRFSNKWSIEYPNEIDYRNQNLPAKEFDIKHYLNTIREYIGKSELLLSKASQKIQMGLGLELDTTQTELNSFVPKSYSKYYKDFISFNDDRTGWQDENGKWHHSTKYDK